MACHVWLFEQEAGHQGVEVCQMLATAEGFTCDRQALDALTPGAVSKVSACAAMAVACAGRAEILSFLNRIKAACREKALIAILPGDSDASLLESADEVVDDFVLAPVQGAELCRRIRRLISLQASELAAVSESLLQDLGLAQFVGRHPSFLRVTDKMPLIAKSGAPVVITGETGTGKELTARAIHYLSPRRDFPFVPVDCGILPENLVENELFGHAKGAFTDAHTDQHGLVALANKGTLFLDEVDALPLSTQAKLLRFLQERTFKPLGSEHFVQVDVNVIAATNRDLESCVAKKEFRSDVYYRLNVFRLQLPPLRDRISDIALLARHFLAEFSTGGMPKILSPGALRSLERYPWPGNVRELFNVMQRAVAFSGGRRIMPEDIALPGSQSTENDEARSFRDEKARTVESFERGFIVELLRRHQGNVSQSAKEAQKDRRSFSRLMKKYNIDRVHP